MNKDLKYQFSRMRKTRQNTNTIHFYEFNPNKKRCCLGKKLDQLQVSFRKFAAGRNAVVVQIQFFMIIFKFFYGIFDQFSDWYYYFTFKGEGKFASETVSDLMLFFLVA